MRVALAFRRTVERAASQQGEEEEVSDKSVKLKFGPIVSCLGEMIAPPGTRPRDGVNLEFESGQLPHYPSNEREWEGGGRKGSRFTTAITKTRCMTYD